MSAFTEERDRAIVRFSRRIKAKKWKKGMHYYLDLRAKGLRGGEPVIRDPFHPRWPDRGRGARSQFEAEAWLIEYIDRLGPEWFTDEAEVLVTVKDYGEAHLEALKELKGKDSSTYKNRRNYLKNHIYPKLGSHRLRGVDGPQVQKLMDDLRSSRDGRPVTRATKDAVYLTLGALWKDAAPNAPVPWKGKVCIDGEDPNRRRRMEAKAGIRPAVHRSLTDADLRSLLVEAMMEDLRGRANPNKRRGVDNLVDIVAFKFFHPVRIEEISFLRGKDVHPDLRAIYIPGTKSEAAGRFCPTQVHYQPWLDRLMAGVEDTEEFLFPTARRDRLPSVSTYSYRISDLLVTAGLKQEGELTHVFRSLFLSRAHALQLASTTIKLIGGHATDKDPLFGKHYNDWPTFLANLPEIAFNIVPNLGTPEEIEEEARRRLRKEGIRVQTGS